MVDKKKSSPNFSKTLLQQLRRTFGARLYPFFDYYTKLYGMASGFEEVPEDLASDFRATMRIVTQQLSKDDTKDAIASQLSEIMPVLRRIEKGADMDSIWRLLSRTMQDAVVTVARDREVYLKSRRIHPQGWAYFKKMSPDEEAMEKLRLRDPDAYAIAQQAKEIRRDVDKAIISKIQDAGYVVEKKAVLGKVVYTGVATDGTSLVFDEDGEVLPIEDYITKRKEFLASYDKLSKTFNVDLESMRAASDEDLQRIATQPVEYVSLTDDRAKQGALTRIYPTRRLGDRKVITEGRFKGIYLDDMINAAGRQIEGVAYDFDPKTGIPRTLESRASGSLEVGNVKEPYITVADDGRLYLKMPATHAFSDLRKAMSDVAKFNTGIEKVAGSRNASFYFSPKDFGSVREALGSVALSKRAAQVIEKYFRTLAKHELATAKENLGKYDASTLGGFREGRNLYTVQKKALAWIDSRGGSGVLALGTGVGKCVAKGTLINTPNGLRPIESFAPEGDLVEDTIVPIEGRQVVVNGRVMDVKGFYYGGFKPTKKLTLRSGLTLEGSHIHPVLTLTPDGRHEWKKIPDLREGDFVCVVRNGEGAFPTTNYKITARRPEDYIKKSSDSMKFYPLPDEVTPELARFMAYCVAEGTMSSRTSFMITQDPVLNPETTQDILNLAQSLFEYTPGLQEKINWGFSSLYIRDFLEDLGVTKTTSRNKEIPFSVLQSSRETQREFLKAFIDAEGSVNYARQDIELSTASETLANQLQVMLLNFGILTRKYAKRVKGYDHTYWRICILGNSAKKYADTIGFISHRKAATFEVSVPKKFNSNVDLIPCKGRPAFKALAKHIIYQMGGYTKAIADHGEGVVGALKNVMHADRDLSWGKISELQDIGIEYNGDFDFMNSIVEAHYFYDPVVSVTDGFAEIMDIEVDDDSHTFVSNGIVSHNTSQALGAIKMAMNEMDAEGKPFRALYVCPKSLKGNLPSEAYQFMEDPKRFIEQTDILSYTEFAKKGKNDPNFLSQYTIILFDEAQELASGTSMAAKIASRPHPRKIFLTASPMEKRPSEVYTLAALANNEDVTKPLFKRNRLNFEKRFCVEIGGRFVGVNPDPLVRRDLRTWVRQNMFHADKQSVEEYLLPDIQKMPRALTLSPEVEAEYRLITKDIKEILAGLVERFRDQKDTKRSRDKLVSTARMKLAGQFSKLMTLSNLPSKIIPGAPNPKIDAASRIIEEKIEKSGRTILFTDIPDMAVETARQLSVDYPGTRHACCLSTKIEIYKNGSVEMTFTPKIYTSATRTYTKDEWQMYVMETYIKPNDYDVVTATLTAPYAKGHNLQMFTTVVHLDRDSWNAEMMQQREARAWRQGQKNSVEAITLDMTYSETSNDYDRTLDEIMRYSQEMEEDLFNQIIVASQTQALGQEYFEMPQEVTSTYYAQRKAFELAMSPYANVHADVVEGENNAAMVESEVFYPHEDLTIEDFLDMGIPYDQLVDPMNKLI